MQGLLCIVFVIPVLFEDFKNPKKRGIFKDFKDLRHPA